MGCSSEPPPLGIPKQFLIYRFMSDISAEKLAARILEANLMSQKEITQTIMAVGGETALLEDFRRELVTQEKLTNFQITRLVEGQKRGYFYGDWKVLYLIGAGTFARVYRGVHTGTGEIKAIKVLRSRHEDKPEMVDDFIREARTVMSLRHPNIIPIHEVDTYQGRSYMVMDFVEGQNLRDFVKTHGQLKLTVALKIAHDLASGLEYAMMRGISHRDLKLSNVLLASNGQAKLADFGLAAIVTDGNEDSTSRSVDYATLEKLTKVKRNDKRSDLFFLGCMLYHMITGEPAMLETRERIQRMSPTRFREIKPITSHNSELPHRVVILVNRLIELQPDKRIQTPGAAASEIKRVIAAVEKGNAEIYDEKLAQKHADEYESMVSKQEEGKDRTVMLIESDTKMQNLLRSKLKELGYRVLIMGNPKTAFGRFHNLDPADDKPADILIVCCKGLGKQGVLAFNQLVEGDYSSNLPAILLLADGQDNYKAKANLSEQHICLSAPLKFKQVRKAIAKMLSKANIS